MTTFQAHSDPDRLLMGAIAQEDAHALRELYERHGVQLLNYLAGLLDDGARLWDAQTGELIATLDRHGDAVTSLAFSPDGRLLATGGGTGGFFREADNTIRLWDVATGAELAVLNGHDMRVHWLEFSRDGSMLVSGSTDSTIRLWGLPEG